MPENRIQCKALQYRSQEKRGFRKTLPSLERPVHVVAERELNPKLRMDEEGYISNFRTKCLNYALNYSLVRGQLKGILTKLFAILIELKLLKIFFNKIEMSVSLTPPLCGGFLILFQFLLCV